MHRLVWNNSTLNFALRFCLAFALIATLALAIIPAYVAQATTINVNTTDDELNSDGDCSLREAIRAANLNQAVDGCTAGSGSDTISVPSGTYVLSLAGANENAALTGDLDISAELTINGAGRSSTTIDADGIDRVFDLNPNITARISGLTISGGDASPGGGVFVGFNSNLTLTNVRISGNNADLTGGGIFVSGSSTVTATNIRVDHNTSDLGVGGAFYVIGTLTLTNSRVDGNSAYSAGGIRIAGGVATINNSVISGNSGTVADGGGLNSDGTLTLVNSTVSGNDAAEDGGGIYSYDGITTLYNVTIANNTTDSNANGIGDGGGVYITSFGYLSATNTIIADNFDNSGTGNKHHDCSGTLVSAGFNLLEVTTGCLISGSTTGNITGVKANLGSLQNNGGNTLTHALLVGSVAIDAGNPAGCIDSNSVNLTTDQRGYARPINARCDMGAYEYNSPGTPTPSPTLKATATASATRTATASATSTHTNTTTPSPTHTRTPTASLTPSKTNTVTPGPSPTHTRTPTASITPSKTNTVTPGPSPTATPTGSLAATLTATVSSIVLDRFMYLPMVLSTAQ